MPPAAIRRLTADDAVALGSLIERARDAGELLGSSSPHGDWVVRYAVSEAGQVAVADADGTLVGTTGECKQGMDVSYKGVWGITRW